MAVFCVCDYICDLCLLFGNIFVAVFVVCDYKKNYIIYVKVCVVNRCVRLLFVL